MKKKYLIFGATGSIGSALANLLYNDKIDCHLIARNEDEVKKIANDYSQKIYVALDVLNNKIMIKGWTEETNFTPEKLFQTYDESDIRGYVLTDIEKDGTLTGLNHEMILRNTALTNKKLIVGGGLKNNVDLQKLRTIKSENLEGVIAGKSFYVGNIDLKEAQKILDGNA